MQKGEIETLKQVCLSILAIGAICTRQLNVRIDSGFKGSVIGGISCIDG